MNSIELSNQNTINAINYLRDKYFFHLDKLIKDNGIEIDNLPNDIAIEIMKRRSNNDHN